MQCPASPTYWRKRKSRLRDRDGDLWTQTGIDMFGEPFYGPTVDGHFFDQYRVSRRAVDAEFGPLSEVLDE